MALPPIPDYSNNNVPNLGLGLVQAYEQGQNEKIQRQLQALQEQGIGERNRLLDAQLKNLPEEEKLQQESAAARNRLLGTQIEGLESKSRQDRLKGQLISRILGGDNNAGLGINTNNPAMGGNQLSGSQGIPLQGTVQAPQGAPQQVPQQVPQTSPASHAEFNRGAIKVLTAIDPVAGARMQAIMTMNQKQRQQHAIDLTNSALQYVNSRDYNGLADFLKHHQPFIDAFSGQPGRADQVLQEARNDPEGLATRLKAYEAEQGEKIPSDQYQLVSDASGQGYRLDARTGQVSPIEGFKTKENPALQAYDTASAQTLGSEATQKSYRNSLNSITDIDNAIKIAPETTGWQANIKSKINQYAQGAGINLGKDFVRNAQSVQEFKKVMQSLTRNYGRDYAGQFTNKDLSTLQSGLPNINDPKKVLQLTLYMMRAKEQRNVDYTNFRENYLSTHGNLRGANAQWSQYTQQHPLVKLTNKGEPVFYKQFMDNANKQGISEARAQQIWDDQ